MKHSINGTCRIVFHRMQKEVRKEFNSEQIKWRHLQNEEKNINALNNHFKANVKKSTEYTRKFHSNEKFYRESKREEKINLSSIRKNSESFINKSLFVKINNDTKNTNGPVQNSIFIPRNTQPTFHKSTEFHANQTTPVKDATQKNGHSINSKNETKRFSSISTHGSLYNNKNRNLESQSVYHMNHNGNIHKYTNSFKIKYDAKSSYAPNKQSFENNSTAATIHKNQNSASRFLSNSKQASKLCTML